MAETLAKLPNGYSQFTQVCMVSMIVTLHLSGDKLVDSMSDISIVTLVIYFSCIRLKCSNARHIYFVSGECVGLS